MRANVVETEKIWLTAHEAAKYLGVSTDYIRSIRESGRLRYYKPFGNKMIFYKKSDIDRFIEKGKQL